VEEHVGPANEPPSYERAELIDALIGLVAAMQITSEEADAAVCRAECVRRQLLDGVSVRAIVDQSEGPLLPERLTGMLRVLLAAGVRVRQEEAKALHSEGVSMEDIGRSFGVSRQRVSTLLRPSRDEPEASPDSDEGRC
jgi:hypothetical protein